MAEETFGDLIQAGLDFLNKENDDRLERVLNKCINLAHSKYVNMQPWEWLYRGNVELTLAKSSTGITLPDGSTVQDVDGATPAYCRQVLAVSLDSEGKPLNPMPRPLFEARFGALYYIATSVPSHYTIEARTLVAMPYPGAADSLHLSYIAGHVDMVDDADVPLVPPDFRDVLVWAALAAITAKDSYGVQLYQHCVGQERIAELNLKHCSPALSPQFFAQLNITGQING